MVSFTIPDMGVVFILGVFFIRSYLRGFLKEALSLAAFGIAAFAALAFAPAARDSLSGLTGEADWVSPLAGPLVFLAAWALAAFLFRMAFRFFSSAHPGVLSRLGGGIIGCVKGACVVAAAVWGLDAYAPGTLPEAKSDRILPYLRQMAASVGEMELSERAASIQEKLGGATAGDGLRGAQEKRGDSGDDSTRESGRPGGAGGEPPERER